jgi:hypothetical protein
MIQKRDPNLPAVEITTNKIIWDRFYSFKFIYFKIYFPFKEYECTIFINANSWLPWMKQLPKDIIYNMIKVLVLKQKQKMDSWNVETMDGAFRNLQFD